MLGAHLVQRHPGFSRNVLERHLHNLGIFGLLINLLHSLIEMRRTFVCARIGGLSQTDQNAQRHYHTKPFFSYWISFVIIY